MVMGSECSARVRSRNQYFFPFENDRFFRCRLVAMFLSREITCLRIAAIPKVPITRSNRHIFRIVGFDARVQKVRVFLSVPDAAAVICVFASDRATYLWFMFCATCARSSLWVEGAFLSAEEDDMCAWVHVDDMVQEARDAERRNGRAELAG